MSADDEKDSITRCARTGVCDYIIKPISDEALKDIYQHGLRKRREKLNAQLIKSSSEDAEVHGVSPPSRKRRDGDTVVKKGDDTTSGVVKKQRMIWSPELHQKFTKAVEQLGVDRAVPKKVLELMNHSGLTRENVASHLQKYRLQLKRDTDQNQTESSNIPSVSSDMMSMPPNDQRNPFAFDTPYQQQLVQNSQRLGLLPVMNMPIAQPHFGEVHYIGHQFSGTDPSFGQPMLPHGNEGRLFATNEAVPCSPKIDLQSDSLPPLPPHYTLFPQRTGVIFRQQYQKVLYPNYGQHLPNQNVAQHLQNQNVAQPQHVQYQNDAQPVQNQNVAQGPTLLQQPFDHHDDFNPYGKNQSLLGMLGKQFGF